MTLFQVHCHTALHVISTTLEKLGKQATPEIITIPDEEVLFEESFRMECCTQGLQPLFDISVFASFTSSLRNITVDVTN